MKSNQSQAGAENKNLTGIARRDNTGKVKTKPVLKCRGYGLYKKVGES